MMIYVCGNPLWRLDDYVRGLGKESYVEDGTILYCGVKIITDPLMLAGVERGSELHVIGDMTARVEEIMRVAVENEFEIVFA